MRRAVRTQVDVEWARREVRLLARSLGFSRPVVEMIVLAISELGTNLVRYARDGELVASMVDSEARHGIRIESRDAGPGIADVSAAMRDGISTGTGLGAGLPAVRRLMDTFAIESSAAGTTIVAHKWLPR